MADADLGSEGRGNLDRLLAGPRAGRRRPARGHRAPDGRARLARPRRRPAALAHAAGARAAAPRRGRSPSTSSRPRCSCSSSRAATRTSSAARLYGGDGALRTIEAAVAAWREAGGPRPAALALTLEPHRDRSVLEPALPGRHAARRRCTAARTAGRCATPRQEAGSERARRGAQRGTAIQVARPWA